jgi:hypothetical protein
MVAPERGQPIQFHSDAVDQAALDEAVSLLPFGALEKAVDIVFLLTLDNGWTRVIGRDLLDARFPRMFFGSDLALLLACDAFDCGYFDTASWWYAYHENGRNIDRFDSDPLYTFTDTIGNIFGFDDPRVIYCRCAGLDRHQVQTFPEEILRQYQGQPEKLAPIARGGDIGALRSLISRDRRELRPEDAINRLREALIFPEIGDYQVYHFTDAIKEARYRLEPDPKWVAEAIQAGLSVTVLAHPGRLYEIPTDIVAQGRWF